MINGVGWKCSLIASTIVLIGTVPQVVSPGIEKLLIIARLLISLGIKMSSASCTLHTGEIVPPGTSPQDLPPGLFELESLLPKSMEPQLLKQ